MGILGWPSLLTPVCIGRSSTVFPKLITHQLKIHHQLHHSVSICHHLHVVSDTVLRTQMMVLLSKNSQPVWWADRCLPVSDVSILPGQGHSTRWDQLLAHCSENGFAGGASLKQIHDESRVIQTQAEWHTQSLIIRIRTATA